MRGRYLALFGRADAARDRLTHTATQLGLAPRLEEEDVLLLAEPSASVVVAPTGDVAVIGDLFSRSAGYAHVEALDPPATVEITGSDGARLLSDYWGGYVAVLRTGSGAASILRDPSGAVACRHATAHGLTAYSSDAGLLRRVGMAVGDIDWSFLAHHLCYPLLRVPRTCIDGVGALLPGMRHRLRDGAVEHADVVWSPWTFAPPGATHGEPITDPDEAADAVAEETRRCVAAWATRSRRPLLELSGGLDSSIVAACLAACGADVACVTLAAAAPDSDERRYARAVARHFGLPLEEVMLDPYDADVRRPTSSMSPLPDEAMLHRIIDDALVSHGDAIGADAFFSGGGGDNVFCYLGTASPAADVLLARGLSRAFFRSVDDVARLFGCTHWRALRYAVRKALWARPVFHRIEAQLMTKDAVAKAPMAHPWFVPPRGAPPGKLEHVVSTAYGQWATDGAERARTATLRYPLLSQPLIELCLRIPTWLWIAGGRNRAVARDAFANDLPREILERRTKGDFTGFMGEVYRHNRTRICELVLNGALVAHGLLDRAAVESALERPETPRDVSFSRLMTLARVEMWAAAWSGGRSGAAIADPSATSLNGASPRAPAAAPASRASV